MDAYVRTNLLPYDFSLTEEQESELLQAVRAALEATDDEGLFSAIIRFKVDEVVDAKIRPWRDASQLNELLARVKEVRDAAPGYVSAFLNGQATPATVLQLKLHFGIQDLTILEAELKKRIQEWIATLQDSDVLQYDVVTIGDLVFAQLRSWC
jgi:hypothetical protein